MLFIIMPRSLTYSLSSMFESYDLQVDADFVSCSFPYRRSSNLLTLNFILFVSAHLYSLCKSFCSICLSSSFLFLEGFEHHRQSMILLISDICISDICISDIRFMYIRYQIYVYQISDTCIRNGVYICIISDQIYVLGIGRALTLSLGVCHF